MAVKARARSGLKPSWPVSATVKAQPDVGVPNWASGRAMVMVLVDLDGERGRRCRPGYPPASTQTGEAKPWTSSRWLQAPAGAMV